MISSYSLTLILAYIHHESPNYLAGRGLAPAHIGPLLMRLGDRSRPTRSLRNHIQLALGMRALLTLELIGVDGGCWVTHPVVWPWLNLSAGSQRQSLLTALENRPLFDAERQSILDSLGLDSAIPIDQVEFARQQLARTPVGSGLTDLCQLVELDGADGKDWCVTLAPGMPAAVLFDLCQMGEWSAGFGIIFSPRSVGRAVILGYPPLKIKQRIEQATQCRLPDRLLANLFDWAAKRSRYRLNGVYLLETEQPEQMDAIYKNRRLRQKIIRQLGRQSAIVRPEIAQPLDKWLAGQDELLNSPLLTAGQPTVSGAEYQWLAQRLLRELGSLIDLPFKPPTGSEDGLAEQIEPYRLGTLEMLALRAAADFRRVVQGRDGFFPAEVETDEQLIAVIKVALAEEKTLLIEYQSLADVVAQKRPVEPFRLEQVGELTYLHGYCLLANSNRVFRLDRIKSVQLQADL